MGVEPELGVVVVLDDIALPPLRPMEQLPAAGGGRHQARGIVVAGGDVQHPGVPQGIGAHSEFVHRGGEAGDSAGGVDAADFPVARVLHSVNPVPAQQLDQQIIKEVRPRADEDVLRIHGHPPEGGQVLRDSRAQLRHPFVGQGQQKLFAVVQDHLPLEAAPHREGEALHLSRRGRGGGGSLGGRSRREPAVFLHEVAHLFPGADVALAEQLLIGRLHGDDADLQMLRQRPLAGKLLPRGDPPGADVLPEEPVQGFIQRHPRAFFQLVC